MNNTWTKLGSLVSPWVKRRFNPREDVSELEPQDISTMAAN